MNTKIFKTAEDAREAKAIACAIDKMFSHLYPSLGQLEEAATIQSLIEVLKEKLDDVSGDIDELEIDNSIVDVFRAAKSVH